MIKPTKHQLEEIAQCIIDLGLSHDEIVDYLMGWFELEIQDIATPVKVDGESALLKAIKLHQLNLEKKSRTLPEPPKEGGWLRYSNTHVNK